MKLAKFPRLRITHSPTPLEPMKRLSEALGGPNLWIKRDDCTGLASGGNKTRKLEYLMAEALQQGADTVITQGATQSNHARQTVAIAAKLGLQSHIILEDRTGYTFDDYKHSGNVFLDQLQRAQGGKHAAGHQRRKVFLEQIVALKPKLAKLFKTIRGPDDRFPAKAHCTATKAERINTTSGVGRQNL